MGRKLILPPLNKLHPFRALLQVTAKQIHGRWLGFVRLVQQGHVDFFQRIPPLAPVAGGAGGHKIFPGMAAAQTAGNNMIERQGVGFTTTILAGVVVTAEDFTFGEGDARMWPFDHVTKLNNRGNFKFGIAAANLATAV